MINSVRHKSAEAHRRAYPRFWQADYLFLSSLAKSIREHAHLVTGRVLDYGCGLQPYRHLFGHATQWVGVDLRIHDLVDVVVEPGYRLPFSTGSFDCVVSFQVLEHLAEPYLYLQECHRVLRPAGRIVITTHGIWPYHAVPEDHYRWTLFGLEEQVKRAKFLIEYSVPICSGNLALLQLANITESVLSQLPRWVVYVKRVIRTFWGLLFREGVPEDKKSWFSVGYLVIGRSQG